MCVTSVSAMHVTEDAALALKFQEDEDHTEHVQLSTATEAQAARGVGRPGVDQAGGGPLVRERLPLTSLSYVLMGWKVGNRSFSFLTGSIS